MFEHQDNRMSSTTLIRFARAEDEAAAHSPAADTTQPHTTPRARNKSHKHNREQKTTTKTKKKHTKQKIK
jgi:hypothetical protein